MKRNQENANLQGVNLRGADLRFLNFQGADLRGANLVGADLTQSCLRGANLQKADLRGADLRGAELSGADFTRACLRNANLQETDLEGSILVDTDLRDAALCGAKYTSLEVTRTGLIAHLRKSGLRAALAAAEYVGKPGSIGHGVAAIAHLLPEVNRYALYNYYKAWEKKILDELSC